MTKPSNLKAVNLLVALFLSLCTLVQAQNYTASAQHYGPETGLTHREVNAVLQDRQGFIGFGTKSGLNRFDGIHFTSYTQQANGLDFDDIQSITQDADGRLWLMGPTNTSSNTLFNPLQAAATRH